MRKGQRFVVNGESGQWYRIRLTNNTTVWLGKEAVKVLESTDEEPAPPAQSVTAGTQESTRLQQHAAATPAQPHAQPQATQPTVPGQVTGTPNGMPGATVPAAETTKAVATNEVPAGIAPAGETAPTATAPNQQPPMAAAAPVQAPRRAIPPRKTGTWFSQFSRVSQVENGKELFFFQVSSAEAVVYSLSKAGAPVLAKARKGDFFPLVEEKGPWCRIALKDTTGWIERDKGSIVNAPKSGFIDEFMLIIIIAAALVTLTLAVALIIFLRRRAQTGSRKAEPFHALIVSKNPPPVQCIVSNKTISLEKYLIVIGFTAKIAHAIDAAQKIIARQIPDVLFIDWIITDDMPGTVELLLAGVDDKKMPLVIFFNVPDISEIPLIPLLPRAYHLGRSFSDHDISKLITPTMLSRTSQKTSAASALEGDIAEGNLPEIMQFIEIGKKNGCLLIETDSPVGMIYFAQGRIIHAAAADGVYGTQAINSVLGLKQGKFRFLLNKQPKASDLNLSTLEVLMEWSKTQDEAHRG